MIKLARSWILSEGVRVEVKGRTVEFLLMLPFTLPISNYPYKDSLLSPLGYCQEGNY